MKEKKNKWKIKILVIIILLVSVIFVFGVRNRCKTSIYNSQNISKITKIDYLSIFGFNVFFLRKNHTEYKNGKETGQFFYDKGEYNINSKSIYVYDSNGNLICINKYDYYAHIFKFMKSGKIEYVYDSLSLLSSKIEYQSGMNIADTLKKVSHSTYYYNKNRQLIKKKYTPLTYNSSNNVSIDTIIYNSKGLRIREIHLQTIHSHKEKDMIWGYDSRDSLIYHYNHFSSDSTIYERNPKGFLVAERHYYGVDFPREKIFYYYDDKDRLIMSRYINPYDYYTVSYHYDKQSKVYKKKESKTLLKIPFILDLCTCYFYE